MTWPCQSLLSLDHTLLSKPFHIFLDVFEYVLSFHTNPLFVLSLGAYETL
jgi:hypothetical protein